MKALSPGARTRALTAQSVLCGALGVCAATLAPSASAAEAPRAGRVLRATADPTLKDVEEILVAGHGPLVDQQLADGVTQPDPAPEPFLDRLGGDIPCGTPIVRAAARAVERLEGPRRAEVALLLEAPRLAAPRSQAFPADDLVIEHDVSTTSRHAVSRRDVDGNRIADVVEAVATDARFTKDRLEDLIGWDGKLAGDGLLRIEIAASSFADGAALGGGRVVLPAGLEGPARLNALAHQVAHAALHHLEPSLPEAFEEAAASHLAATIVADADGRRRALAELLPERHAARALFSPGLQGSRGDALFLRWVSEQDGVPASWLEDVLTGTTRRLDTERKAGIEPSTRSRRSAVVEALDEILARHGSSLADAVAGYQMWTLEEELSARGARTSVDAELASFPRDETGLGADLPPFAQLRFGLDAPASGGLRVALASDERVEGHLLALLDDGSVRTFPLDAGLQGTRSAALPGSHVQRLVVLLHAPTIPVDWAPWDVADSSAPGNFTLTVTADDGYPFVLRTLDAVATPDQITIEWSTSSEEDLVGWHVERSLRPSGPFGQVSVVPFPALSRPGQLAGYAFVDPTVKPGTRYHYRVRAVTTFGMGEPSAVVTVRTLPEGPR